MTRYEMRVFAWKTKKKKASSFVLRALKQMFMYRSFILAGPSVLFFHLRPVGWNLYQRLLVGQKLFVSTLSPERGFISL